MGEIETGTRVGVGHIYILCCAVVRVVVPRFPGKDLKQE